MRRVGPGGSAGAIPPFGLLRKFWDSRIPVRRDLPGLFHCRQAPISCSIFGFPCWFLKNSASVRAHREFLECAACLSPAQVTLERFFPFSLHSQMRSWVEPLGINTRIKFFGVFKEEKEEFQWISAQRALCSGVVPGGITLC